MTDYEATNTQIRIRFVGTEDSENFNMRQTESNRFHPDWTAYLNGDKGSKGGEYICQEGDHSELISINFAQIAYTMPGKQY